MAARSIFLTLARNLRGYKKFRFRSISSSIEAVKQETITAARAEIVDDFPEEEEEKDDLKSRIFRLRLPKRSATNVLEKWVGEGNEITISDLRSISRDLRRSHRYKHALEISEWMVSRNEYQLSDSDFAVRINLMTRVFGIDAAERYFEGLPPSSKTSETYTALLHSYASLKLSEKAELLYERIKGSDLSLNAITFNELMTLYISVGQLEKVPSVIEDMKTLNVARDLFTYNLWVSSCAAALKIDEAEKILDEICVDPGCDETWIRYSKLARIYIIAGQLENSVSGLGSLVESEKGVVTQRELISYDFLVILYGGLGNKDRVDQIWQSLRTTRQKMTGRNYVCVLSSYLMLGHLREAGEIVDQWKQSTSSEFNLDMCNKVVKGFKEVGMEDKTDGFHVLAHEKGL
ncbi:Pentatricopeptide repeat-containing protein -mitochondrial [Striga hermonthica]|uniref:Pentatricopeptide repeat-containing protein -mitochondrial n=1 Tax=Striga hermonthica TaxID=68872 RepID=A0A9N7MKR8_STRHE|nr:Pentatricopeptide repeat-containing protein -mitochondrial [Striga hermonthica]